MKYIILLFCIIIGSTAYSQIKIGPSIGLNQSYVYASENSIDFNVINDFKPNLSFGVRVEKSISKINLDLIWQNNFHRKTMEAYDRGLAPLTSVRFGLLNNSLMINKKIYSGLRFGGGFNYSFIPKINNIYSNGFELTSAKNKYDLGLMTSLNYKYKNVILDFNYCYAFFTSQINKKNAINRQMLEPISFIRLEFAYLFPVRISHKP